MKIKENKDNLEKALTSLGNKTESKKEGVPENTGYLSKEEEIGFHKGSLNTLMAERNEIFRMLDNIEAITQAHLRSLQKLGVKINFQKPEKAKK